MKAIVQDRYGSEGVLRLEEIDRPTAGDGDVLVRVQAASIHLGDRILMSGSPFVMRMATGLRRPKQPIPGTDIAGTIEAVGSDVTTLKVGDEVLGWGAGAFAELMAASEDQFIPKPSGLTFEQAAAIGVSATTALQLLRDDGHVQPGQQVLINGASGGVGTFAVQIAKAMGAVVTGVTSTRNLDLVRSIGADHVIDYTQVDFREGGARYDLILDNVGDRSMAATRRALAPTGMLISNGGGHAGGKLGRVIRGMVASMIVRQQAKPTVKTTNRDDLAAVATLVEAGELTPVVDQSYPLTETAAAIRRVGTGRTRGTLVITVAGPVSGPTDHTGTAGATLPRPVAGVA
jgi:NADPH:quinone reductase-like Zn-dependent oxidoreductase